MRTQPLLLVSLLSLSLAAQTPGVRDRRDGLVFAPKVDAKLDGIRKSLGREIPSSKPVVQVDFSTIEAPGSNTAFTAAWHQAPVCQGLSGMCWSFGTTSLMESEAFRLHGRKLRLSVLHTVYWEYVEKARGYVQSQGKMHLGEGSQPAAMLRAWKAHGVVPAEQFTGLKEGATAYDHEHTVFPEVEAYLKGVKASGKWDEEAVIRNVRTILDRHLGAPPETVLVEGRKLTPKAYLKDIVGLNPDDYVAFVSFLREPYGTLVEYPVPDNWWHGKDYHNLPLGLFTATFKKALQKGFTVAVAGDVGEPGYSIGAPGLAVVPSWDIPASAIDEKARQFRFSTGQTQDDHVLHAVGWTTHQGQDWFLLKDSWSSAWNNEHPGYYYLHEDYLKLKILAFLVHKDGVAEALETFQKK